LRITAQVHSAVCRGDLTVVINMKEANERN